MISPDQLPEILSEIQSSLNALGEDQLAEQVSSILGYSSVTSEFYGHLRQVLTTLHEAEVLKNPDESENVDRALELANHFYLQMFRKT